MIKSQSIYDNLALILLGLWLVSMQTAFGQNSVLNEGTWYKISTKDKGIYKLDRSFLENIGINTNGLNPRNIAIYGNGAGGMLPQLNSSDRTIDLIENAIFVEGESDGIFNNNDYVLFFANTTDHLQYQTQAGTFSYEHNLYVDSAVYFITIKDSPGKRISRRSNVENTFPEVSTYADIQIHELDLAKEFVFGGRMWFGERFAGSNSTLNLDFNSRNIVEGSNISIIASFMSQAFAVSSFDVNFNGQLIGNQVMSPLIEGTYEVKGDIKTDTFRVTSSSAVSASDLMTIQIKYHPAATGASTGYLDYVLVQSEKELTYNNGLHIFNPHGLDSQTFQVTNANVNMRIWDVTDPTDIIEQEYVMSDGSAQFGIELFREQFILFEGNNFPLPTFKGRVNNQNLRGLGPADALFITHKNFLSETNRLAQFRTQHDGLVIHVVTVDQIYNEFNSGMQDVSAIRDFARQQYSQHDGQLKYLLLFGDCSYDYKYRLINKQNYVPVYQARNSLDPIESFSSDDYFGFMEDGEGEWLESRAGDHTMELGIGRLPVKTLTEARQVVNKIIRYQTSTNAFGNWRNNLVFIADDGDQNIHQRDADKLAVFVDTTRTEFNVHKIYLDAFDQIPTPNGENSPSARKAIENAFTNGSLMINYTGHGNEEQLALEDIIDKSVIQQLTNRNRLPFFITATCDFGTYDDPALVSGGESIILNSNGGAIALLTATRPVFSNTNFILNRAYYFTAMDKSNGSFPRLGDIIRNTKNTSLAGPVNRNFALLGDPTMKIAYPEYEIKLTTINGSDVTASDTLRALSQVSAQGEIVNFSGNRMVDFNGTVTVKVFDKATEFITKGNENGAPPRVYNQRDVLLYQGDASVVNGEFSFEFIVPKNISYVFGQGKVSMYAVNELKNIDAHGADTNLIIGGSDPNAPIDDEPPLINLFLNDSTFQNGQRVEPGPVLVAKLSDENGINISRAGFGQDILATIDGEEEIILNEYYTASNNTFKDGFVVYELKDLASGRHTLSFRAFDTHGNESVVSIDFTVGENRSLSIREMRNFPNPFSDETTFTFTHDREGEELMISLHIINLEGREITNRSYRFDDSPETIDTIRWDGRDTNGNRAKKGIYIYKIVIQSTLDGAKNKVFGKLVVFN